MADYAGFSTRYIGEYQIAMRIELSDSGTFFSNDELNRGVIKATALMSRLIPKRAQVETQITIAVEDETLTISSSTGTLTYKPVKAGSVAITGKTIEDDFTVNYLTGVVTEVGSNLTDDDYTVNYEIDPYMLDISSLLSDYIKIERIEYPVGEDPPTLITIAQEVYASTLTFKQKLGEDKHIRITYLTYWTAPAAAVAPDYPASLDNAIVIGGCGEALIFKAEKYVQSAVDALAALTAPTVYTIVKPDSPTLPTAPTAPTAPELDFTEVTLALDMVASFTEEGVEAGGTVYDGRAYLVTGIDFINASNTGKDVAENYGKYAEVMMTAARSYIDRALAHLKQIEEALVNYGHEITSFGSEAYAFASEMSGTIGKYQGDISNEEAGITLFKAAVDRYVAQANEQQMKASNYLNIAGRYLASGQSKINEMLVMLGMKPEFNMYKSSSEQFA